ncbi:unnamed protein product [Urochloa humidicola]
MEPDARSPSETDDAARVAIIAAPEMDAVAAANRRLAGIRWRIRFLTVFLSYALSSFVHGSTGGDRDGIDENEETTDPRRSPAHRRMRSIHTLFDDDTAPQSEGGNSITSTTSDDTTTTRRPGTAHAHATPQGEGRRDSTTSSSETTLSPPDFTFTANVDGSRGLAYRSSVAARHNEAPAFAAVIGLLAYGSCVVIGLLTEFDHTVTGMESCCYGLLRTPASAGRLATGVWCDGIGGREQHDALDLGLVREAGCHPLHRSSHRGHLLQDGEAMGVRCWPPVCGRGGVRHGRDRDLGARACLVGPCRGPAPPKAASRRR